jgi:hypothetical protein
VKHLVGVFRAGLRRIAARLPAIPHRALHLRLPLPRGHRSSIARASIMGRSAMVPASIMMLRSPVASRPVAGGLAAIGAFGPRGFAAIGALSPLGG